MVESDLEALRQPSLRTGVAKLRDSHLRMARLFASGLRNYEIAEITGYAYNRVSMLRSDPAMVERVARLREALDADWREEQTTFESVAIRNMTAAERQLSDKLDEADAAGETLPTRELLAITSDRMDRFGYGKKNMNVNVNVDFAAKLEAAISRTKKIAAE